MKDTKVWTNNGFIGHQLLTSNLKEVCHRLVFLGAELVQAEGEAEVQYKINFMLAQQFLESNQMKNSTGGCSVSFSLMVSEGEDLRFERFLGIHREITVEYAPEDFGSYNRFFSVKSIKFLEIKKDFIKYEISCY